jgi:hypothetical protein
VHCCLGLGSGHDGSMMTVGMRTDSSQAQFLRGPHVAHADTTDHHPHTLEVHGCAGRKQVQNVLVMPMACSIVHSRAHLLRGQRLRTPALNPDFDATNF